MWMANQYGWFSITQATDPAQAHKLQVRARDREQLAAFMHAHSIAGGIVETPRADYPFRVYLPANVVARIVSAEVKAIDYSNFKDQAAKVNGGRSRFVDFLHKVWSNGLAMQTVPGLYTRGTPDLKVKGVLSRTSIDFMEDQNIAGIRDDDFSDLDDARDTEPDGWPVRNSSPLRPRRQRKS